jgi:hypothetical protein
MSLALNETNASADDYLVLYGQLQVGRIYNVGRIYKRKVSLRPGSAWLRALDGVPEGPCGPVITGVAATFDEAVAALKERWAKWLASADLSESA